MPSPVAAIAGGSVVSGVLGSRSASKATAASSASSAASLALEKKKYKDWKKTYGGVEENLSEYYNSVTPDYYEARGLEAFQKEQQFAIEQVNESFAQRGIEDSGIALASDISFAQEGATQRATIRTQAPALAAEEQLGFLQVGLGQNPGQSYSRSLAEKANRDAGAANQANAAAGRAVGNAVSTAGSALADYLATPAAPSYTAPAASPYTAFEASRS